MQEIKPNSSEEETNRNLLANLVYLASKNKQLVEKAMNELSLLASKDVLKYVTDAVGVSFRRGLEIKFTVLDFRIGASFGLATGYIVQKQAQRARNVLKIVAKTAWKYEEAEYLERCWLMLAEHYIQSGKLELAHELMKKILTYNAGCEKAYELQGIIAEKDHKFGNTVIDSAAIVPVTGNINRWTLI